MRPACAASLLSEFAACASGEPDLLEEALAGLDAQTLEFHLHDWLVFARDDQLPPAVTATGEPWRTWLVLGGRGAGKTRAGAEWIRGQALGKAPFAEAPVGRMALVGETMHDVRSVMVEGISGLLAIHPDSERPVFEPSRNRLVWPNGAIAQLFSAEDPDSLRGPQFGAAWADEVAKWRYAECAWDMLQFALRLGNEPRTVATTTPRSVPLLKRLMGDAATVISHSRTVDNSAHLAPSFLAEMKRRYAGSVLGRQELDGEMVVEVAGALWRRDWIEQGRADRRPELQRVVVAIDPPVTATAHSDACGIVVVGRGEDGRAYVIDDRTVTGRSPELWARAAIAAYRDHAADRLVAEVNQGGDMVETVIRQIDPSVPLRKVRATRGKWLRAEPVAALYAEGRVVHVGAFPALEEQMCLFGAAGAAAGRSPDRLDALVWALTDLILDAGGPPSVRPL